MDPYKSPSKYCYDLMDKIYPGSSLFHVFHSNAIRNINVTGTELSDLKDLCDAQKFMETGNNYSEPMVWIGIYIAIASIFCIIAMAADLLHGLRNRKFWFPCKYFSLNAASITVITIAMKLPVDLSSPMPAQFDQATKMGSMAFMCTIMANLMPSLASMDNKTLLANLIGLVILVITMVINIYIEIFTGVIDVYYETNFANYKMVAYIYTSVMLLLLIILISSAITIPTAKQILEFKYQANRKKTSSIGMRTEEEQKQHVRRYWIMAESGSPQFVMASNPLSNACGIICLFSLVVFLVMVLTALFPVYQLPSRLEEYILSIPKSEYSLSTRSSTTISEYKWSILFIFLVQFFGVLVGSIAPIFRCFTVLNFTSYTKWKSNHFKVSKVEKYWTQKLFGWKESRLPFLLSGRRSRLVLHYLKNLVVDLCIRIQIVVVASCKIIGLVGIPILVCCSYFWKSMKKWFTTPIASSGDVTDDLRNYVLQIQDEVDFAEETVKGISNSMNRLLEKVENEQHGDLIKFLEKSTGFEGVKKFDIDEVQSLLPVEIVNSWSLPLITLTCIAISLPNIHKDKVERLFKSVGDGLSYTHIVEESLNTSSEYVNVRKASMDLWYEVEETYKWLGNTLEAKAYERKPSEKILKWFANKAKEIVLETQKSIDGEVMDRIPNKLIAANSMYRIAKTILHEYERSVNPVSGEQLFDKLSSMIADILCACLTNIPEVITRKCDESSIEKREASVQVAAKLLGRSMKIITNLRARELPNMDPDKIIFIDEWRLHLKWSIP